MGVISNILSSGIREAANEEINWNGLKIAADTFLREAENAQIQIAMIEKRKMQNKLAGKDTTPDNMLLLQHRQQMYNALFEFDEVLTKELNELPKMGVYVSIGEKSKSIKTFVVPLKDLVKLIDYEGKIVRGPNAVLQEKQKALEIQMKQNADEKEHADQGKKVVKTVLQRLDNFYQKFNSLKTSGKYNYYEKKDGKVVEKQLSTQRQGGLLMWKIGGNWKIALVANAGVVTEAYVNFLFTKHNTPKDVLYGIKDDEVLVDKFYNTYMQNVTNVAASLEEDVVVRWGEQQAMQFAVKATKAELPNIAQYIRIATGISNGEFLSADALRNAIKSDTEPSTLAPLLRENLTKDQIKEMVSDYQNKNGKQKKLNPNSKMIGLNTDKYQAINTDELLVEAAWEYIKGEI